MKWILYLACVLLCSCKPSPQDAKELTTPEEQEVLDEMQKTYKK